MELDRVHQFPFMIIYGHILCQGLDFDHFDFYRYSNKHIINIHSNIYIYILSTDLVGIEVDDF
jgi:hypothetical protein